MGNQNLEEYLEILKVLDPHANMLYIKDFPELEKYRDSLKSLGRETAHIRVGTKSFSALTIYYGDIKIFQSWWAEVFPQGSGFAYVSEVDAFFFGYPDRNRKVKPLKRMEKFVKTLKERGFL